MSIEHDLSPSDRERVRETLARLSNRINRDMTLSSLLDEWRRFVVSIIQGYCWAIETYNHDLAVRDIIEEISESLSMAGRRTIELAVGETDQDFIRATWDPDQPSNIDQHPHEIGWWQFRIPRKPDGKLLEDLRKLGHVYNRAPEKDRSPVHKSNDIKSPHLPSQGTFAPGDSQAPPVPSD